jgi:hypothetical protein
VEKIDSLEIFHSSRMSSETLTFQPPHPHNEKETKFLQSLPPKEKELHELATKMLGSSYFAGKTHGFTAWAKSNPAKQSPTTN